MSWIGSLAGRAENFLNLVDQAAGQALQKDAVEPRAVFPVEWNFHHEPFEGGYATSFYAGRSGDPITGRQISLSSSVPVNLNRLNDQEIAQSTTLQHFQQTTSTGQIQTAPTERQTHSVISPGAVKSARDEDEELFQFLNSPEASVKPSHRSFQPNRQLNSLASSGEEKSSSTVCQFESPIQSDDSRHSNLVPDGVKIPVVALRTKSVSEESDKGKSEPSELSVENENKFLKQEVAALTQELSSVFKRNQDAQDGMQTMHDIYFAEI